MPVPSPAVATLPRLLQQLLTDPGRPRLTWYGPQGERIELSGHVLDNWVTKSTNLLIEEYDAGPRARVLVDLPVHWRAVVWALAAWRTGACVLLPDDGSTEPPDVVVTDRPAHWVGTSDAEVVAVALPALARAFDGDLPVGATDAAAAVMTYGDVLTWVPEHEPAAPALHDPERGVVTHAELLDWAGPDGGTAAPRLLLEPEPATSSRQVLATVLSAYRADGSVVLCAPPVAGELAADPGRRARLIASERITTH